MVLPQNELSDHCKIVTVFKPIALNNNLDNDNYNWIKLNSSQSLYEIKQRIEQQVL